MMSRNDKWIDVSGGVNRTKNLARQLYVVSNTAHESEIDGFYGAFEIADPLVYHRCKREPPKF